MQAWERKSFAIIDLGVVRHSTFCEAVARERSKYEVVRQIQLIGFDFSDHF